MGKGDGGHGQVKRNHNPRTLGTRSQGVEEDHRTKEREDGKNKRKKEIPTNIMLPIVLMATITHETTCYKER